MTALQYPAAITTALHKVMETCAYVQKTGKNKFHDYKYAGEADLLAVLRPAMVENGLLLIPSAESKTEIDQHGNTTIVMEYTLAHKDGAVWPEKIRAIGTGNDRNKNGVGDKGTYKAITGANKYLLFKLFQIETGDDPDEDQEVKHKPTANGTGQYRDDMDKAGAWKDWAMAAGKDCDAAHWLQEAANAIRELISLEDLSRWQKVAANRHRIDALREHHEQRYNWLMVKVEDKREALKAKEAA